MRVCPHCHHTANEDGAFCPACGKSWAAEASSPAKKLPAFAGTFLFPPAVSARRAGPTPAPPAPPTVGGAAAPRVTVSGTGLAATAPTSRPAVPIAPVPRELGGSAPPATNDAAVPRAMTTQDSLPVPDPRAALLGSVVDGFAIDSILGSGGCGTVYRGRQLGLDRPVAIKVPTFDVVDDPVLKKRFLREARAAARVRHPSVVTIYGVGEVPDGRPYLAMELLDGVSLAQVLDDGPLPVDRALKIARKIALALAETHAAGVVHRDLKPSNIIWRVDRAGEDQLTIVDFGIAAGQQGSADATRLTAGGKVIGTPHYMAPEQAQGEHRDIDHRSDLYALGCVLFELLTAEVPFDGQSFEVVLAHMTKKPPAPSTRTPGIPAQVDALVADLLRKRPEERLGSADEAVRRLDELLQAVAPDSGQTDPSLPNPSVTSPSMAVPAPVPAPRASGSAPARDASGAVSRDSSRSPRSPRTEDGGAPALAATAPAAPAMAGVPRGAASPAAAPTPYPTLPPPSSPTLAPPPSSPTLVPSLVPVSLPAQTVVPPPAAMANRRAAANQAQLRTEVSRGQVPWRAVAAAAAVVAAGAIAAVALRSSPSAAPPAPGSPPAAPPGAPQGEPQVRMMMSESVAMRVLIPERLAAGALVEVSLELWADEAPLTEQEVVVTVRDPAGKFTGFRAKPVAPSGYAFEHRFDAAGHYVMNINVPVDNATFEVDLDVGPSAKR